MDSLEQKRICLLATQLFLKPMQQCQLRASVTWTCPIHPEKCGRFKNSILDLKPQTSHLELEFGPATPPKSWMPLTPAKAKRIANKNELQPPLQRITRHVVSPINGTRPRRQKKEEKLGEGSLGPRNKIISLGVRETIWIWGLGAHFGVQSVVSFGPYPRAALIGRFLTKASKQRPIWRKHDKSKDDSGNTQFNQSLASFLPSLPALIPMNPKACISSQEAWFPLPNKALNRIFPKPLCRFALHSLPWNPKPCPPNSTT